MTAEQLRRLSSLERIAARAAEIYDGLDDGIKKTNAGRFMAVDVKNGRHYIAEDSADALRLARSEAPHGVFHLLRIGAPSAFKFSHSMGHDGNRSRAL